MPYVETEQHNYQYIVVELDRGRVGLSRDQLQRVLWAENVISRRYFYPGCHRMEPYRSMPRYGHLDLPATDALASRVLCLPTGTAVTVEVVEAICDLIAFTVRHGAEIAHRLQDDHTGWAPWPDDLTRQ